MSSRTRPGALVALLQEKMGRQAGASLSGVAELWMARGWLFLNVTSAMARMTLHANINQYVNQYLHM